jgi:hypothetical protein
VVCELDVDALLVVTVGLAVEFVEHAGDYTGGG